MYDPDDNGPNGRQIELDEKLERVRRYLGREGYSSAVIGRRDNFAWLTSGGDSKVVRSTEVAFGVLVVTLTKVFLVAHTMDIDRIFDDELSGTNVERVPVKWYQYSREEKARTLCDKGRVLSDILVRDAAINVTAFYNLQFPLTRREIDWARRLAVDSEKIIRNVADQLTPEMTERQVAGLLGCQYELSHFDIDVLLVGGSKRIGLYRHPIPSEEPVGNVILLHPAVSSRGLHANITRMVCLGGTIPSDLERKYTALCEMEAASIAMCEPGMKFKDIFERRKEIYRQHGYEDEWENHFPGGPTGYMLARGDICADESAVVSDRQLYDWFITITGAKVEELGLVDGTRREFVSAAGAWPTREFLYEDTVVDIPWLLVR